MSETITQRTRDVALAQAEALKELLLPFADAWRIAGSIRRGMATVSDCDHVVVPKLEAVQTGGLFGDQVDCRNLLWAELDRRIELDEDACIEDCRDEIDAVDLNDVRNPPLMSKAIKTDKDGREGTRWGMKLRSVHFRGFDHEIYTTTPDAWGITLLIRTGPAAFSRFVVTELKKHGYRAKVGRVERKVAGDYAGVSGGERWEPVAVPTERDVFDLIGMTYREPNQRNGRW